MSTGVADISFSCVFGFWKCQGGFAWCQEYPRVFFVSLYDWFLRELEKVEVFRVVCHRPVKRSESETFVQQLTKLSSCPLSKSFKLAEWSWIVFVRRDARPWETTDATGPETWRLTRRQMMRMMMRMMLRHVETCFQIFESCLVYFKKSNRLQLKDSIHLASLKLIVLIMLILLMLLIGLIRGWFCWFCSFCMILCWWFMLIHTWHSNVNVTFLCMAHWISLISRLIASYCIQLPHISHISAYYNII